MAQLPNEDRINQYTATAGQTTFSYDFMIYTDVEIKVQLGDDTLVIDMEYTVTDAGEEAGGTVVLVTGAAEDDIITLTGNTIVERGTTFTQGGAWNADDVNGEYDRIDNLISEVLSSTELSFRLAASNDNVSLTIPDPEASKALVWNDDGTALINSTFDPDHSAEKAAASAAAALVSEGNAANSAIASSNSATEADGSASDANDSAVDAAASAASIDLPALGTSIIPDTSNTYNLGTSSLRFDEVHCKNLYGAGVRSWGDAQVYSDLWVGNDVEVTGDVTAATFNGSPLHTGVLTALYTYSVAYNIDGGGSSDNTWMIRPINTEVYDDIGITLSSNALTLPAGTYRYHSVCQVFIGLIGQSRIYQTSGTPTVLGVSVSCLQASTDNAIQMVDHGTFILSAEQTIEVQTYSSNGTVYQGLGLASDIQSLGNNIYLTLLLEKV